jgi:hypothetical protein
MTLCFSSLFEGFLVQVDQMLRDFAVLCNMISTTTVVALEGFLSFPQTLVFGFLLLVLIFFPFLNLPTFLDGLAPSVFFYPVNYS